MTHAKHLTYGFLGVALGALIMSTVQYSIAAWQGPTATPPNNNVDAPINVGTVAQTKNANLSLGSGASLYAGGLIAAPQLCIGSDCRTAWPVGGTTGSTVTGSVVAGCDPDANCWGGAAAWWPEPSCPAGSTRRTTGLGASSSGNINDVYINPRAFVCLADGGSTAAGDNLGNHTATMNINMGGSQVTNIGTPVNAGDAATKGYIDGKFPKSCTTGLKTDANGNLVCNTPTPPAPVIKYWYHCTDSEGSYDACGGCNTGHTGYPLTTTCN